MRHIGWFLLLAGAAVGCSVRENPFADGDATERSIDRQPPVDNNAFGNVQPHHVYDSGYHEALLAYGPSAIFVCNASLDHVGLLEELRALTGPDATLLANDPSGFVPIWAQQSDFWNAYREAMNPANVGLPDTAWYWHDELGNRRRSPRPCGNGGWCGETWPGWALKPDTAAYRAKAEFLASHLREFDGLWLDEWREGFSNYQARGLDIPLSSVPELTKRWRDCRKFYIRVLRESVDHDFLLIPNLQPVRRAFYPPEEMARFDGHTTEFPNVLDFARFGRNPSPWNVGWGGGQNAVGVVRKGYGLPANVDP